MSDWWERRKKRSPWFDIFEEFNRIEEMMNEMMRRIFEAPPEGAKAFKPYVYGFSVSTGPDGEPVIQQFGNVQLSRLGPKIREEREPLIDIMNQKDVIVVVAELPGVEKSDIDLKATESKLTISVEKEQRKYFKELDLPESVDPKSAKARYKNGVLEVRLKKAKAVTARSAAIKVE